VVACSNCIWNLGLWDHVVNAVLGDLGYLVFVLASMDALEAFGEGASKLDASLALIDTLDKETDFRLHQAIECQIIIFAATSGNDTEVILVVASEKRGTIEEGRPRLLSREDISHDAIGSQELFHHNLLGRRGDAVRGAHGRERRCDDGHEVAGISAVVLEE
jgi:hypothetical protein